MKSTTLISRELSTGAYARKKFSYTPALSCGMQTGPGSLGDRESGWCGLQIQFSARSTLASSSAVASGP